MIVGNTGFRLDASTGQKINEGCFELGLSSLEVITNQDSFLDLGLS